MNNPAKYSRIALGLVLLLSTCALQAEDVKPGLWNISLTMTPEGAAPIGPFSQQKCFTKADAQDPQKLFAEAGGVDCSYGDTQVQGNHLSFSMRCGGEVPLSGHGSVTFNSTSFEGEMDVTANISGIGEIQSKNQISGKRAGDC